MGQCFCLVHVSAVYNVHCTCTACTVVSCNSIEQNDYEKKYKRRSNSVWENDSSEIREKYFLDDWISLHNCQVII